MKKLLMCENAFGVDEKLSSRFLDHILELRQYHQTCSDNHLFTKHVQIRRSVDKNFVVIMYLFISNGKSYLSGNMIYHSKYIHG